MFDIWWGEVNLTVLVLVLSVLFLMPLQIWLCFKVKSLFVRLFPVGLLTVAGGWFLTLFYTIPGWDGLGYILFAVYAAFMIVACGVGWGMWALWRWRKKRNEKV